MERDKEMSCKELVELVTDYLEDALSPEDRLRFRRHLSECPGCEGYLEQMRLVIRAAGSLSEESLSEKTRNRLLDAFRTWKD